MANEAVLMIETESPISMTVNDGVGIEKGTILALKDPFGVSGSLATDDIVAGISAEEKIANDGQVKMSVYQGGFFKVIASGSIAIGDSLGTASIDSAENYVYANKATTLSGSYQIGIAYETASDEETFLMKLNPRYININKQ